MSSGVLPKEQLSAYQRWELAALAGPARAVRTPGAAAGGNVALPTAGDIERMHQAAHDEGYAAGLAEGRGAAATRVAGIEALLRSLADELRDLEAQIAEDLLSLALTIARQVLREALPVKRELILPLVREAMQELPHGAGHARLVLHPADAQLVRGAIGDTLSQFDGRIVEDGALERGGCRIDSTITQVDATVAGRWGRACASLGRDHAWLEHGAAQVSSGQGGGV